MAARITTSDDTGTLLQDLASRLRAEPTALEASVRAVPCPLFATDRDRRILAANAQAEALFGWPPGGLTGRSSDDLIPARLRNPNQGPSVPLEDLVSIDMLGVLAGGREALVHFEVLSVSLPQGLVFLFTARERAELDRARDAVLENAERLRMLLDNVKDYAIFMLDGEGRVRTWNVGAERTKGYRAEEIVGQSAEVFYPPEYREAGRFRALLEEATRTGRAEDAGWHVRKGGERFWAEVSMTAVRDPAGTLVGFAKVTRDVTERKRAEEERLRLLEAQQALRLRDEFLSIASHELRTPLTALQLQLGGLENKLKQLDQALGHRLGRARRSAGRLAELIDALLDVSRIAAGRFELKRERVDLAQLAREVVERFRETAAAAGCELRLEIESTPVGTWDALRVEQVLTNLLSNAVKYASGAPVDVTVDADGKDARLVVCDHGPGIPKSEHARIFERFERAASRQHFGGLGLGLYVTRQIAEAHHGSVTVESPEDGGAKFVVRLPTEA